MEHTYGESQMCERGSEDMVHVTRTIALKPRKVTIRENNSERGFLMKEDGEARS